MSDFFSLRSFMAAVCFVLLAAFLPFDSLASAKPDKPFTIVIDPGHGGKDFGCIGRIANEKSIVLDVATRLGKILNAEHPDVKTIFTRTDDRFIALNDRAAMANRAGADLFVSIHVNSVDKRTRGREKIAGASVYTLGLHRSDDNLAVAMRENGVIELENDFSETYQGFDPTSSESYIIFELTQNRHMAQSVELADAIQRRLTSSAGRLDKGVRQSGFLVLRATSMPSVLIELDFICNPDSERFLASGEGRDSCARAIADALSEYLETNYLPEQAASKSDSSHEPYYAVHLFESPDMLESDSQSFNGVGDVNFYNADGACHYVVGHYKSLKDAKKHLHQVLKTFPQAFIIKL